MSLYFHIILNSCYIFQSLQTTEDQKWEHMLSEWNKEKIKLMNAMIGPSQNWLDLKKIPEPPSIADTPKKFGHSMLDNIEAAYAKQVQQYNKLILQGAKSRVALHQKFAQVADEFTDPVSYKNCIMNCYS